MTRRPHYAWMILAVTFLALLAGAGIRATPSVLIVPLEQEFGWAASTISLAISINIFLYGLMGPFAGALMQRLGVRRTCIGALAAAGRGRRARDPVTRAWQLVLLWGVVVGIGQRHGRARARRDGGEPLVRARGAGWRWACSRRSTATGQLVFLPLLAGGHRATRLARRGVGGGRRRGAGRSRSSALLLRERPARSGLAAVRRRGDRGRAATARRIRRATALAGAGRRRSLARLLAAVRHVLHLRGVAPTA